MTKNAIKNNLKEVSLWPLFLFSIPSIFSSLLEPMASIVDTALVGNMHTEWLGALAVATIIFNAFTWVFNFLVHVSTQQIGNFLGKYDSKSAVGALQISLIMSLGLGLVTVLILFVFKETFYELAGSRVEYYAELDSYFTYRLLGQPIVLIAYTLLSALRAYKFVNFSFIAIAVSTLFNISFSWFFLYQLDWGISGIAIGTVLSHLLICVVSLAKLYLLQEVKTYLFKVPMSQLSWGSFRKTSWYFFGRSLALTSVFFISNKLAANLGVNDIAGHQVMMQAWLFSSFFIDGLAITANVLGSRFIGANELSHFKILVKNLSILSAVIGLVFTIVYFVGDRLIIGLFTNESSLVSYILTFWWVIAATQIVNAMSFMADGLLYGAGHFKFIRNLMWGALVFGFAPFAFISISEHNYIYILYGLVAVNGVRFAFGYAKILRSS